MRVELAMASTDYPFAAWLWPGAVVRAARGVGFDEIQLTPSRALRGWVAQKSIGEADLKGVGSLHAESRTEKGLGAVKGWGSLCAFVTQGMTYDSLGVCAKLAALTVARDDMHVVCLPEYFGTRRVKRVDLPYLSFQPSRRLEQLWGDRGIEELAAEAKLRGVDLLTIDAGSTLGTKPWGACVDWAQGAERLAEVHWRASQKGVSATELAGKLAEVNRDSLRVVVERPPRREESVDLSLWRMRMGRVVEEIKEALAKKRISVAN